MKRKRKLKQFLSVMFAFLMVLSSMSLTPLKTKAMIEPLREGVMERLSWLEGSGADAVLKVEMLVPEDLNIDFNFLEFFGSTVDIKEASSIEDCEAIMTPQVGVNMDVTKCEGGYLVIWSGKLYWISEETAAKKARTDCEEALFASKDVAHSVYEVIDTNDMTQVNKVNGMLENIMDKVSDVTNNKLLTWDENGNDKERDIEGAKEDMEDIKPMLKDLKEYANSFPSVTDLFKKNMADQIKTAEDKIDIAKNSIDAIADSVPKDDSTIHVGAAVYDKDTETFVLIDSLGVKKGKTTVKGQEETCKHDGELSYSKYTPEQHKVYCNKCDQEIGTEDHDFSQHLTGYFGSNSAYYGSSYPENLAYGVTVAYGEADVCSKCNQSINFAPKSLCPHDGERSYSKYTPEQHKVYCNKCDQEIGTENHDFSQHLTGYFGSNSAYYGSSYPENLAYGVTIAYGEADVCSKCNQSINFVPYVKKPDLSGAKALIEDLKKYTADEAKLIELEINGEKVDKDTYTVAVEKGKNNTWIVTFEPVEGKSIGKKQIEVPCNTCNHIGTGRYTEEDPEQNHTDAKWYYCKCRKCNAVMGAGVMNLKDKEFYYYIHNGNKKPIDRVTFNKKEDAVAFRLDMNYEAQAPIIEQELQTENGYFRIIIDDNDIFNMNKVIRTLIKLKPGSTIIELPKEYTDTLSVGEHTCKMIFSPDDADIREMAEITFEIVESEPKEKVEEKFTDVKADMWYVPAVQFVYDRKYMNGVDNALFAPDMTLTREQFVTIIYNIEGSPEVEFSQKFDDVKDPKAWYAKAVIWAYDNKVTSGVSETEFGTGQTITREQLATMLYNYATYKKFECETKENAFEGFPDSNEITSWATEGMTWAVSNGIMSGKGLPDGTKILNPGGKASRAECAQMVKNLYDNVIEKE